MKHIHFQTTDFKFTLEVNNEITTGDKQLILSMVASLIDQQLPSPTAEIVYKGVSPNVKSVKVEPKKVSKFTITEQEVQNKILFKLQKEKIKCSPGFDRTPIVPVTMDDVPPNILIKKSRWYKNAYASIWAKKNYESKS